MARHNVLLGLGIALAAILVSVALLIAPEYGVPRWVFVPIAVAGLLGSYMRGVRKAKAASVQSRVFGGLLWATPWFLLLCLPWGMLAGGYGLERLFPVVPPDGGLPPNGVMHLKRSGGFQYGAVSNLPWTKIEEHYFERLSWRGWQHDWTRDFRKPPQGALPGDPLPRLILYRRFDGLMLVCFGTLPNGQTIIVPEYMFLKYGFDAEHLLREEGPSSEVRQFLMRGHFRREGEAPAEPHGLSGSPMSIAFTEGIRGGVARRCGTWMARAARQEPRPPQHSDAFAEVCSSTPRTSSLPHRACRGGAGLLEWFGSDARAVHGGTCAAVADAARRP